MFYILYGEDTYSQQATLTELKNKLGDPEMLSLNTTVLDGHGLAIGEVMNACNAFPFLSPKRLIIVHNYFSAKPAREEMDKLLAYLPELPDSARLFFLESDQLSEKHPAIKLAQSSSNGYAKFFGRLQGRELERWIFQRCEALGGRIHPRAVHLLAVNAGSDLQLLENELTKLVLYKGLREEPEQIIDLDVIRLSPYAAEANIFDLVDALGSRNSRRAAALLQQKLATGSEPFQIFAMFIRQFRLLIQVKECLAAGMNQQEIARTIKQHPFVVGKIMQQSASFSLDQLDSIYRHLLEVDIEVKTGRNDLVTALNILVFSLA